MIIKQLNHNEYVHEVKKFPVYLVLDKVSDPVNIGSIFRLADALGVSKIYLCNTNIDINYKKIKRVSRSTNEYVEYEIYSNIVECINEIKKNNIKVLALEITDNSISLNKYEFDKNKSYAFIIGNEQNGISKEALDLCDESIHIDMYGNNSSMNVSVATAIAVYQCVKNLKGDL